MYIYIYIYICIYIYVHICICFIFLSIFMFIFMLLFVFIFMCVYLDKFTYSCVYTYIIELMYIHISMQLGIYIVTSCCKHEKSQRLSKHREALGSRHRSARSGLGPSAPRLLRVTFQKEQSTIGIISALETVLINNVLLVKNRGVGPWYTIYHQ